MADVPWFSLLTMVTLSATLSFMADAQDCFGGIETFEKMVSMTFSNVVSYKSMLQQPGQAITRDCINLCKQQATCLSFGLNYNSSACVSYNVNSIGRGDDLVSTPSVNFFEKICFRGVSKQTFDSACRDRLWVFDRVRDAYLEGHVDKEARNVRTKEDCEKLCITEDRFKCRSADYDEVQHVCRMSRETRRTKPLAFKQVPGSYRNYLENQCAPPPPGTCKYETKTDVTVLTPDYLQFAASASDCMTQCDAETAFNCWAYSYVDNRCQLSGDSTTTWGKNVELPHHPVAVFGQLMCFFEQCDNGVMTFEKMTGVLVRSAQGSMMSMSKPGTLGNTLECIQKCLEEGMECPAFSDQYHNMRCDRLDRNSNGRTNELIARDGESYFEKMCLQGPEAQACSEKGWAFERALGYELAESLYTKVIDNLEARRECIQLCLAEREFICRSARYNEDTGECKLSTSDRRTDPNKYFRSEDSRVSYLENSCLPAPNECSYVETPDAYATYTNIILTEGITTLESCQILCDNFKDFPCRSFSYYSSSLQCFLSGDDKASAGSAAIQRRPGIVYYERMCPQGMTTIASESTETELTITSSLSTFSFGMSGNTQAQFQERTTLRPRPSYQPQEPQRSECSPTERLIFEKLTGYEPFGATSTLLYRGDSTTPGITAECIRRCQALSDCRSFVLDHRRFECSSVQDPPSIHPADFRTAIGKTFFGGICVPAYLGCSKLWVYERITDHELQGLQPIDVIRVVSLEQCQQHCLETRKYVCRSANYFHLRRECHVFGDDRTAQKALISTASRVDFFENQCLSETSYCPYQKTELDLAMIYVTKSLIETPSTLHCERECNREREFNCRSYTFWNLGGPGNLCMLSGESRLTGQAVGLQYRQGASFASKMCKSVTETRQLPPTPDIVPPPTTKGTTTPKPEKTLPPPPPYKPLPFPPPKPPPAFPPQSQPFPPAPQPFPPPAPQPFPPPAPQPFPPPAPQPFPAHPPPFPPQPQPFPAKPPPPFLPQPQPSRKMPPPSCTFDRYTYEKIVDYDVHNARRERLPTRVPIGVIEQCQKECQRLGERCRGFVVQYKAYQDCFLIITERMEEPDLVPAPESVFFKKICLRERSCGKLWTFDRVLHYELITDPMRAIIDVFERTDCEDLCLQERPSCRSATYHHYSKLCQLFTETRRSAPNQYRHTDDEIEYLENQCIPDPPTCQYRDFPDRFLPQIDRLSRAFSLKDCQRQCDTEKKFTCRSINFETVARDCALSSEDLSSVPRGLNALQARRNSLYSEKGNCEQVSVQCNQQDMLLTIHFESPFHGRVYAKGNPAQCYVVGTGQSTLQFAIALGSRCGTRPETQELFVNEVVVQQHPVIMTDHDKTIKVVCSFETEERTYTMSGPGVGSGMNVARTHNQIPITAIVTNTAAPPNVVMRVLDQSGRDARAVGLGEELTLKIELTEPSSAFAIFARNLYARSSNGESLFLIDSSGCPTDATIFPALQLDRRDRKSLLATFKAFRFPSTGMVNFEVQIRFCQEKCEQVRCGGKGASYGRRKRDISETSIIPNGTSLDDDDVYFDRDNYDYVRTVIHDKPQDIVFLSSENNDEKSIPLMTSARISNQADKDNTFIGTLPSTAFGTVVGTNTQNPITPRNSNNLSKFNPKSTLTHSVATNGSTTLNSSHTDLKPSAEKSILPNEREHASVHKSSSSNFFIHISKARFRSLENDSEMDPFADSTSEFDDSTSSSTMHMSSSPSENAVDQSEGHSNFTTVYSSYSPNKSTPATKLNISDKNNTVTKSFQEYLTQIKNATCSDGIGSTSNFTIPDKTLNFTNINIDLEHARKSNFSRKFAFINHDDIHNSTIQSNSSFKYNSNDYFVRNLENTSGEPFIDFAPADNKRADANFRQNQANRYRAFENRRYFARPTPYSSQHILHRNENIVRGIQMTAHNKSLENGNIQSNAKPSTDAPLPYAEKLVGNPNWNRPPFKDEQSNSRYQPPPMYQSRPIEIQDAPNRWQNNYNPTLEKHDPVLLATPFSVTPNSKDGRQSRIDSTNMNYNHRPVEIQNTHNGWNIGQQSQPAVQIQRPLEIVDSPNDRHNAFISYQSRPQELAGSLDHRHYYGNQGSRNRPPNGYNLPPQNDNSKLGPVSNSPVNSQSYNQRRPTQKPPEWPANNKWGRYPHPDTGDIDAVRQSHGNQYPAIIKTNLPNNDWRDEANRKNPGPNLGSRNDGRFPGNRYVPNEVIATTQKSVPEEVPLSLAILVGEDGKNQNTNQQNQQAKNHHRWRPPNQFNRGLQRHNIINTPRPDDTMQSEDKVCTSKATIIATAVSVTLVYFGIVAGAFIIHRWYRKNKKKKTLPANPIHRFPPNPANANVTYSTPDVTFRNVYGNFPVSSTSTT